MIDKFMTSPTRVPGTDRIGSGKPGNVSLK